MNIFRKIDGNNSVSSSISGDHAINQSPGAEDEKRPLRSGESLPNPKEYKN